MGRFEESDILLTFQEAAELLRVSRATMYRLLQAGHLAGHKVGRTWRFYKTDVHTFVASQTATTAKHHPVRLPATREVVPELQQTS